MQSNWHGKALINLPDGSVMPTVAAGNPQALPPHPTLAISL
jgi:hypothetical protein